MRRALVRFLILTALATPAAALADTRSVEDPPNPNQELDPVRATSGHDESRKRVLVHTITTAEPTCCGGLYELTLRIWLPHGKRSGPDRQIVVTGNGYGPTPFEGLVYDRRARVRGQANVWRPDDRTLRIEFDRRLLRRKPTSYEWVMLVQSACRPPIEYYPCGGPKFDRVPDTGRIEHRR